MPILFLGHFHPRKILCLRLGSISQILKPQQIQPTHIICGLEVRVETPGEDRPDMVRGSLACYIFRKTKSLSFWANKGQSKKCFQKLII